MFLGMLWAVFLLYLFVFLSLGRLFALHAAGSHTTPRPALFNPAACLVSGAGLWVLWWLVLVPLSGAGTFVVMLVFVLFSLGLTAAMYRTWHGRKGMEHFLTPLFLSALLFAPFLLALPQATPAFIADYTFLTHLQHLVSVGGWPTAIQASAQNITELTSPPGWMALLVPLGQAGLPLPALAPMLSFVAVLAAAGAMTTNVGIPVRWSNLLLATCAGLLIVTATLPMPWPLMLEQQSGALWMALGLLVAVFPLFAPLPLPVGIAVLPCGLALALVATLHPQGLLMGLWIALMWLVRLAIEGRWHKQRPNLAGIMAIHLLVLLPLLGWGLATLVWQKAGGDVPAHWLRMVLTGWGGTPASPSPALWWQAVQWAGILGAMAYGLWPWLRQNLCGGLRGVVTTHAWRSMATPVLGGLFMLALVTHTLPAWLPALGWIALCVLWKRGLLYYQTTAWQRRSFAMPWRLGALMALLLLILAQSFPKPQPTVAQQVVRQLQHLTEPQEGMTPLILQGNPVALWMQTPLQDTLLPIAGYALAPHVPVLGLEDMTGGTAAGTSGTIVTLGELHRVSRAGGANYLVVVAPTAQQRQVLRLPEDAFLALFTTTPQNVLLTALFSKNGGRVKLSP